MILRWLRVRGCSADGVTGSMTTRQRIETSHQRLNSVISVSLVPLPSIMKLITNPPERGSQGKHPIPSPRSSTTASSPLQLKTQTSATLSPEIKVSKEKHFQSSCSRLGIEVEEVRQEAGLVSQALVMTSLVLNQTPTSSLGIS